MDAATLGVGFRSNPPVVRAASLATPNSLGSGLCRRLGTLYRRRHCLHGVANVRAASPQHHHWAPEEEPEDGISQRPLYHPFEEMADPLPEVQGEARLTDAEMARTIIEVRGITAFLRVPQTRIFYGMPCLYSTTLTKTSRYLSEETENLPACFDINLVLV